MRNFPNDITLSNHDIKYAKKMSLQIRQVCLSHARAGVESFAEGHA